MNLAVSRIRIIIILGVLILSLTIHEAAAARIGEMVETDPWDQMKRFITLSDRGLRLSLIGALLFGAVCGLFGCFIFTGLFIVRCPPPTNQASRALCVPLTECIVRLEAHVLQHHSSTLSPLRQENFYFLRQIRV